MRMSMMRMVDRSTQSIIICPMDRPDQQDARGLGTRLGKLGLRPVVSIVTSTWVSDLARVGGKGGLGLGHAHNQSISDMDLTH